MKAVHCPAKVMHSDSLRTCEGLKLIILVLLYIQMLTVKNYNNNYYGRVTSTSQYDTTAITCICLAIMRNSLRGEFAPADHLHRQSPQASYARIRDFLPTSA